MILTLNTRGIPIMDLRECAAQMFKRWQSTNTRVEGDIWYPEKGFWVKTVGNISTLTDFFTKMQNALSDLIDLVGETSSTIELLKFLKK